MQFYFFNVFIGFFTSYSLAGWKKSGKLTGFSWVQIIWNRVLCAELFLLFILPAILEFELQFKNLWCFGRVEWQKNGIILITDDRNPVDSTKGGSYLIKNNKYRITGLDSTLGVFLPCPCFLNSISYSSASLHRHFSRIFEEWQQSP